MQIHPSTGHNEAMSVLLQTPVADLGVLKKLLDREKRMLDRHMHS